MQRIAQKIKLSKSPGEKQNPYRVTDMIRASIVTPSNARMVEAYQMLKTFEMLKIIRVTNKLDDSAQQNVVVNVIYNSRIIGEIIIRHGSRPANYYANQFLSSLMEAGDAKEF